MSSNESNYYCQAATFNSDLSRSKSSRFIIFFRSVHIFLFHSTGVSGFLCRLVMLYSYSQANIIIPWFLIYISVEFFILRRIRSTNIFPEEFQPLLQMLPKETLPFDISFVGQLFLVVQKRRLYYY